MIQMKVIRQLSHQAQAITLGQKYHQVHAGCFSQLSFVSNLLL